MRIVVLTPTYAGYDTGTKACIAKAVTELPIDFVFLTQKEVYIHAARRKLLQRALELHNERKFDYFLWLDSDVEFEPKDITTLIEDIESGVAQAVTGLYFSRHGNNNPMICMGNPEEGFNFQIDITFDTLKERYFPIDGCGFGLFMLSAKTIEAYTSKYKPTEWFDSSGWFPQNAKPEDQQYVIGEDIDFCQKYKAMGGEIYVDAQVLLGHKGVGLEDWFTNKDKNIVHCGTQIEDFNYCIEENAVTRENITRRAVLYVGYVCNLKCKFCYYAHKDEKEWRPLGDCKREADLFRGRYNNNAVDITGGEPTIYPDIKELVRYCRSINLKPTLITNLQALAHMDRVKELKEAGVEDFLCSIHALGDQYCDIVGNKQGFDNLTRALENIKESQVPFRANCTLIKQNYQDLLKIAQFVHSYGGKVLNFISYNPFYEWAGREDQDFQVTFAQIEPYLREALDYCDSVGIEANVRYYPFCMMKGHEAKCYNFAQLPFDPGEWDFKSWYTDKTSAPSHKFNDAFYDRFDSEQSAYFEVAKIQRERLYGRAAMCSECALRKICDGVTKQYLSRYGDGELKPYDGDQIARPDNFVAGRRKYLCD